MRQARRESEPDRFNPYPDDRYRGGGRADRQRDRVGDRNDHVRVMTDNLTSEIVIAFGPPLAGIALDDQVSSLDIAQAAQLFENGRQKRFAGLSILATRPMEMTIAIRCCFGTGCAHTVRIAGASNKPIVRSRRLIR